MPEPCPRRCAIYTRTSSEERLDRDYNSLASQRDACAAYIRSQRHEGWVQAKGIYDDGGFSGGSLDRPALNALLADMAAGEIDVIVIYKIDRLTRSLRDFAKLSELRERHGASFVSVTQQFNTASSMGRLTLNILLTFAQFEREMAGDRIRDKRASSVHLGLWMGGHAALGYEAVHKKLVVNPREAETVRYIFRRFVELQSLSSLRKDLKASGIVSKRKIRESGEVYGGNPLAWHPLRAILTNPLYCGMIRHKGQTFRGRHAAIIDGPLFDEVQKLLQQDAASQRSRRLKACPFLLKGIIYDTEGIRLYTHHSLSRGRRYDYYFSRSLASRGGETMRASRLRVPARALERYVVDLLCTSLRDPNWLAARIHNEGRMRTLARNAKRLAAELEGQLVGSTGLLQQIVCRVEIDRTTLRVCFNEQQVQTRLGVSRAQSEVKTESEPWKMVINGHPLHCTIPLRLVLEDPQAWPTPDRRMIREVLRAVRWFDALSSGRFSAIEELAKTEGCSPSLISDRIRLAFLAPDIAEAILEGRQPPSLTSAKLRRSCPFPVAWSEQRSLLL